jgi:hypothetical protein
MNEPSLYRPRRNVAIQRQTARALTELGSRTQIVQAKVRATSAAAEFALSEVTFLKRTQRELERA